MKKHFCFLLILLSTFSVYSQQYSLKGTVNDQQNTPLSGVNIIDNQNISGTQSDDHGNFELIFNKKGNYQLIFSYVGYISKKVNVSISEENTDLVVVLDESNFDLDQVVILSNRDREFIDEIPSSVSVITPRDLEAISQHSNTLADIVANVPGVALSTNTSTTRGQNIRGRNMLVLIDGIPQSTPLFVTNRDLNAIDPTVIERVEIIKGGTSIYGNGAEGGIINYITKKANSYKRLESSSILGTSGSLVNTDNTIGSNISQLFKGQLSKFNYVVSGSFKETGIMRSANNEISSPYYGLGETESYNVFTKVGYDFNYNNRIELMYNYFSSNQNSNLLRVDGVYGETPTTGVFGETNPAEADQGTKYNHNIRLNYTSNNVFKKTDIEASLYAQSFATVYGFSPYFTDVTKGYEGGQSQVTSDKKGARLNLNTSYVISDNFEGNLIYGIDFMGDNTEQTLVDSRVYTPEMAMNNFAPYLQIKANLNDLILKGGIRYENINVNINDYTTLYRNDGTASSGGIAIKGDELNYNALAFNFGARYNKWEHFQPFVSFAQSFSVGELGRILRGATAANAISGKINTEAVIANNYELGLTSNLTSKIKFQGVYFLSTSDLGTSFSENSTTGQLELERLPEKIYGIELQLDARLTDKLNFGVSLATVEGKTDNNDNGDFNDEEDAYINGTRINPTIFRSHIGYQFSPKWNARLSNTFSGNRKKFEANDGGGHSYGNAPVNSFNTTSLFSSYQLTNNTKLLLGIDNLFNEDYYTVRSQWAGRDYQYEKGNGINFKVSLKIEI